MKKKIHFYPYKPVSWLFIYYENYITATAENLNVQMFSTVTVTVTGYQSQSLSQSQVTSHSQLLLHSNALFLWQQEDTSSLRLFSVQFHGASFHLPHLTTAQVKDIISVLEKIFLSSFDLTFHN